MNNVLACLSMKIQGNNHCSEVLFEHLYAISSCLIALFRIVNCQTHYVDKSMNTREKT
jgi:hypothetical protein